MPERLRCWLLCEDIEQERLFRPILERHFRRVYVEPRKPHGGASFVLQRVERLANYIRQHHQEAVGLPASSDSPSHDPGPNPFIVRSFPSDLRRAALKSPSPLVASFSKSSFRTPSLGA